MTPEVRINIFGSTFGLILCRFHQGYIPARAFSLKFDRVARAHGTWQSFAVMQICWGAIDHGHGDSGTIPRFRSANAEFLS